MTVTREFAIFALIIFYLLYWAAITLYRQLTLPEHTTKLDIEVRVHGKWVLLFLATDLAGYLMVFALAMSGFGNLVRP